MSDKSDLQFKYCLYRINEALDEMNSAKRHTGRRHLEKALYVCTGFISNEAKSKIPTYDEMRVIEKQLLELPLDERS